MPLRRFKPIAALVAALAGAGCGGSGAEGSDASPTSDARAGVDGSGGGGSISCIQGSGRHRLFVQGAGGAPFEDGSYPLLHELTPGTDDARLCDDRIFVDDANDDGRWQPGEEPRPLGPRDLVHGEHFLVGPGAFAEFRTELCADITGEVAFYIPNFDVAGSKALHQLFVVHDGQEFLVAEAADEEAGMSGYNPFVRVLSGNDPDAVAGDQLLLRSTNLNGYQFSVMVWQPPSEYESWILVNVP